MARSATPIAVQRSSYSLRELEAEREEVRLALQSTGAADSAYLSIDKAAEQIVVEVPIEPKSRASVESDAVVAAAVSSGRVRIEDLEGPTGDDVAFRGGEDATGCTWGFSLGTSSNANWKGLSTSGHCGTSQSFLGRSLTYLSEYWQDEKDVQIHSVPANEIIVNDVWINAGGGNFYRDITATTGWSGLDEGDVVCMRGAATAYHCATIEDVTSEQANQSGAGGWASHAVRTSLTSAEGDSGAPIIFGQTAIGNNDGRINGVETFISLTYNYADTIFHVRTK